MIWDLVSPVYDLFEMVANGKVYRGIGEEIKNYVGSGDDVLECACGTGALTAPIAKRCGRLVATDISIGMMERARRKVRGCGNVKFRRVSIYELPFRESCFDVVVAANVIHLLDDPQKAMAQLVKVCKPDGKIVIPTYINVEKKFSEALEKLFSAVGIHFAQEFTAESYKEFFAKMGFENVEYKIVDGIMPCEFAIISNFK